MPLRSLKAIEFDKVRTAVASRAISDLGARRAEEMTPDPDAAPRLLAEAAEMMAYYHANGDQPLEGLSDVGPLLSRLEKEGVLVGPEVIRVRDFLVAAARAQRAWRDEERYPRLASYAGVLSPLRELEEIISRQLDDDGAVRDDATPLLASIRKRIAAKDIEIQETLERMLKATTVRKALREPIVTQRGGRYVLPVRTDSLHAVRGVVHGHSSSGVTAFVEPMSVVTLNNQREELKAEEEAEITRILRELSYRLAQEHEALEFNLGLLEELDFIAARAAYAGSYDGAPPLISPHPYLELRRARHPLLIASRPLSEVVPIDFLLGGDYDVVIISGPNNGGKTVAMKTACLLTAMALAGIPIPAAAGSTVGAFRRIFADIGDESSLEGNLSTFTAHMTNVRTCLETADEYTLVALDELGVGTSPKYGVAIATAVLVALARRGAKVICTTHYDELKTLALEHPRFVNGAVEIDPATMTPTYELKLGRPGTSEALIILRRLGFAPEVIADAEARLGRDELSLQELIKKMEEREAAAAATAAALAAELEETRRERIAYEERKTLWEEQSRRRQEEAYDEAARILADARRQANLLIRELREKADVKAAEQARRELLEAEKQARAKAEEARAESLTAGDEHADIQPGDWVSVKGTSARGQVAEVDAERKGARVRFGGVEAWVAFADLAPAAAAPRRGAGSSPPPPEVGTSLNVIGLTVEEAINQTDKYLDRARRANLSSVEIIHGHGTGRLREGIRRFLRTHGAIASFGPGPHGNEGVTVVVIKAG